MQNSETKKRQKKDQRGMRRKGGRGTVSVFLVLILVPCIIVCCLFGDVSRVELSKAEASSASDLAMYSLLSHYDEELKEYYGLVASCQDIESFYDVTATYFTGMMSAQGISGEGSALFLDYLNSLKSGDISDFLQVEFTTPATVTETANSAMGDNAALLEDSIVEFMKYRGPYEILTNVISQLQKKNVLEGIDGAKKDKPITEAHQEYAEAESEMLQKALYVYAAIRCYTDTYDSTGVPSSEKYKEYAEHLKKIADDFSKVTEIITEYYAGTDGIYVVSFPTYSLNAYTGSIQAKNVGEKVTDGSETIYCIDKEDLEDLLKDIDTKRQEAENAASNIANACSGLPDPTPADTDVNPAIYCMKVQNSVSSGDLNVLIDRGDWLMRRYAALKVALDCEPYPEPQAESGFGDGDGSADGDADGDILVIGGSDEDELPDDWRTQIQNAITSIEQTYQNCYASGGSSAYLTLVSRYRKTAESNTAYAGGMDTVQNVKERRYEFYSDYLGRNARVGEFIEAVQEEFNQIDTEISEQISHLNTVIYGGNFSYNGASYSTVSLDSFKSLVLEYSSKREDWGSAITSSGSTSSYAQSEKEEYEGSGDDEGEKLAAAIAENNGECVDILKTRLLNIRNDMQDFQKALKNFKYGGMQVTKLGGREETIQAARTVIPSETDISLAANRSAAVGYYSSLLSPDASNVYTAPEVKGGEDGNKPDLNDEIPALYQFLNEQFRGRDLGDVEAKVKENEEKNEEYKKQAEEQKENSQKVENKYLKGKGGDLSSSHGGTTVSAFTAIDSIATVITQLMEGNGDELRDQLYVAEYIMDMFSYSTFNNEGQHRLAAADGKQYTLSDFTEDGYPGYTETWAAEDKTKTAENQSLTNQPINAAHNQMNLGEVEYILYGNTSIDANLETSYKNIFAIRELLNLVSGFQNFYTGTNDATAVSIQTIAASIMTATAGVVPEALTKCVLIGVLATMESAHDVERLKAGVPVVLYKGSSDRWYCAIDGEDAANFSTSGSLEVTDEDGIYYSDYLYFFLLLGTMSQSTYSAILLRAGDLIEANMQKMGADGFDLSKSRCYFTINAELKVKPLLLDLPLVQSEKDLDVDSLTSSSGWCTYKVNIVRGYS